MFFPYDLPVDEANFPRHPQEKTEILAVSLPTLQNLKKET